MAVDANDRRSGPYTLTAGQTGPHSFDYVIAAAADLRVTRIRAGVETLLALTTDYTVSVSSYPGTGTITLVAAPLADDELVIDGARDIDRATPDFVSDRLDAADLNTEYDTGVRDRQEIDRDLGDCVRVPRGEGGYVKASAANRANKYEYFDANGAPVYGDTTDLAAVAAAIADVNTVADDLNGADTIGAVAADLSGANTIGQALTKAAEAAASASAASDDADAAAASASAASGSASAAASSASAASSSASAASASAALALTRANAVEMVNLDDVAAIRSYFATASYGAISGTPIAVLQGGIGAGGPLQFYVWAPLASGADDGRFIIQPTGHTANGRFVLRSTSDVVRVSEFCVCDGAADDTAVYQALLTWAATNGRRVAMGPRSNIVRTTSAITFPEDLEQFGRGRIFADHDGDAIIIGGSRVRADINMYSTASDLVITGMTKAAEGVFTSVGHGMTSGARLKLPKIAAGAANAVMSGRSFRVDVIDADTFKLEEYNSATSGFDYLDTSGSDYTAGSAFTYTALRLNSGHRGLYGANATYDGGLTQNWLDDLDLTVDLEGFGEEGVRLDFTRDLTLKGRARRVGTHGYLLLSPIRPDVDMRVYEVGPGDSHANAGYGGSFSRVSTYNTRTIAGITLSGTDPVAVSFTQSHNYATGQTVSFADVGGTTELNGNAYVVTVTSPTAITLDGTNSSLFTAWTSGGNARVNTPLEDSPRPTDVRVRHRCEDNQDYFSLDFHSCDGAEILGHTSRRCYSGINIEQHGSVAFPATCENVMFAAAPVMVGNDPDNDTLSCGPGLAIDAPGGSTLVVKGLSLQGGLIQNHGVKGKWRLFGDNAAAILNRYSEGVVIDGVTFRDNFKRDYLARTEARGWSFTDCTSEGLAEVDSTRVMAGAMGAGVAGRIAGCDMDAAGGYLLSLDTANTPLVNVAENETVTEGQDVYFDGGAVRGGAKLMSPATEGYLRLGAHVCARKAAFAYSNSNTPAAATISGVTLSGTDPVRLTLTGHGYGSAGATGRIYIKSVTGTVELNDLLWLYEVIDANTVELTGTDSSDFTAWVSGGSAYHAIELGGLGNDLYWYAQRTPGKFIRAVCYNSTGYTDIYPDPDGFSSLSYDIALMPVFQSQETVRVFSASSSLIQLEFRNSGGSVANPALENIPVSIGGV